MDINKFRKPSIAHKVDDKGDRFTIRPVSNSRVDVENFQVRAKEAENYVGCDFSSSAHKTSRFGVELIDMVMFSSK